MKYVNLKALAGSLALFAVTGGVLFLSAWTLDYWQAWVFLAAFFGSAFAITVYLMKKDPRLLERRISAGPLNEKEASQKIIQSLAQLSFILLLGTPLALGSWWGVLTIVPITAVIVWRLLDEERFLAKNLPGYAEYENKVKYRLIPFLW